MYPTQAVWHTALEVLDRGSGLSEPRACCKPGAPRCAVLVVDDDPRVRAGAVDLFEEWGATVFDAYNAAQAFALLKDHPEIELLFADIQMPNIDGMQLAGMALALRPGIRVILTSGYRSPPNGTPWPFLPKPWRPDDLRRLVSDQLGWTF